MQKVRRSVVSGSVELSVTEKARAIYLAVKDVPGISATVNSRYQELAL